MQIAETIIETKKDIHKISTTSPLVYTNMGTAPTEGRLPGLNGGGAATAVPLLILQNGRH